jgi:3',5'-cyclic AMP phosphodiesterase CpdA
VLIVQISDLHVNTVDGVVRRFVNANETLAEAVTAINAMTARPDVVLATGDLTDHGTADEYALLAEILSALDVPIFLLPGNHDDVATLTASLGAAHRYLPETGPLSYVLEDHPVRIVALDTTDPAKHSGVFPADREAWLEATLSASDRPTLLAMHHPPFDSGIWWMDAITIEERDRLEAVIRRHPQVRQVISGHVHRATYSAFGETLVSICPSTAHQTWVDLDDQSHPLMTTEPPALQLHAWTGSRFVSNTRPLTLTGATFDLVSAMSNWDRAQEVIRRGPPFPKGGVFG